MPSSSASSLAPTALNGPKGPSPLVAKITSVLSKSYSDTEFRGALSLLDERQVVNEPETRRQLRINLQKEVIDSNAEIIHEFGKVSEVSQFIVLPPAGLTAFITASPAYQRHNGKVERSI